MLTTWPGALPVGKNTASAAHATLPPVPDHMQTHRVVQFNGKRYSLKLNDDTWAVLEQVAARRKQRLGKLIDTIAHTMPTGSNLAASLRSFCLTALQAQIVELKDKLSRQRLVAQGMSLSVIADACPTPCFVANGKHLLMKANRLAQKWLGLDEALLLGKPLEQIFQVKTEAPLAKIIAQFGAGRVFTAPVRLVCLLPGRVIMARGTLCPAIVRGPTDVTYLIIIENI